MTSNFFKSVYLFMRLLTFTILVGCGSVQSVNGISVKKKPAPKKLIMAGVATFAVGYHLGNNLIPKKK
jgi:hypothetical protein